MSGPASCDQRLTPDDRVGVSSSAILQVAKVVQRTARGSPWRRVERQRRRSPQRRGGTRNQCAKRNRPASLRLGRKRLVRARKHQHPLRKPRRPNKPACRKQLPTNHGDAVSTREYQSDSSSLPLGRSADRVKEKRPAPHREERATENTNDETSYWRIDTVFPYQKSNCALIFAYRAG